ncbi:MAG: PKD domain-containing protein [Bacteroidetes bacterium]|nr:PKD domain-containing protein [Bacteroidota bacterium]
MVHVLIQIPALYRLRVGSPVAAFNTNANCSSLAVQFNDQSTITGGTIAELCMEILATEIQVPSKVHHMLMEQPKLSSSIDSYISIRMYRYTPSNLHLSLNVPDALFSLQNGCIGSQINFTNQSTSPTTINSWMWYFGDGSTSTVSNPAHIYSTAGAFNASLVCDQY